MTSLCVQDHIENPSHVVFICCIAQHMTLSSVQDHFENLSDIVYVAYVKIDFKLERGLVPFVDRGVISTTKHGAVKMRPI